MTKTITKENPKDFQTSSIVVSDEEIEINNLLHLITLWSSRKIDYNTHKCNGLDGSDISFTKKDFESIKNKIIDLKIISSKKDTEISRLHQIIDIHKDEDKNSISKSVIKDTIFLCTRGDTGDINKERFEKELKL